MRFVPDTPITNQSDDALGTADFLNFIHRALMRAKTPFVFGLLGGWGTGKTSILQMLQARLLASDWRESPTDESPHPVPIWFNAWKYENESNVIYPLLYHIRKAHDELQLKSRTEFYTSFRKVVSASAMSLLDLGLRFVTKQATGEALKLSDVEERLLELENEGDKIDTILGSWADSVGDLREAFQELIERYAADYAQTHRVAADTVRFVILIDDLDRCLPDVAVAMLEKLKNFLAVERCIYVLSINPEVIYQGIRVKYQGGAIDGREYLEKILNYSFYVPAPVPDALQTFAASQLRSLVDSPEEQEEIEEYIQEFGRVVTECRFENPRKLKRILNRYLMFLAMYQSNLARYVIGNIVRLIILAEYYPDVFHLYMSTPEANKDLKSIGSAGFDVEQIEHKYGFPLSNEYAELARMRALFALENPLPAAGMLNIELHARSVYAITRLS